MTWPQAEEPVAADDELRVSADASRAAYPVVLLRIIEVGSLPDTIIADTYPIQSSVLKVSGVRESSFAASVS